MDAFSSDDPFIDHLLELAFGVDTFALLDPSEMHILSAPSLFPTMHPSSLGASVDPFAAARPQQIAAPASNNEFSVLYSTTTTTTEGVPTTTSPIATNNSSQLPADDHERKSRGNAARTRRDKSRELRVGSASSEARGTSGTSIGMNSTTTTTTTSKNPEPAWIEGSVVEPSEQSRLLVDPFLLSQYGERPTTSTSVSGADATTSPTTTTTTTTSTKSQNFQQANTPGSFVDWLNATSSPATATALLPTADQSDTSAEDLSQVEMLLQFQQQMKEQQRQHQIHQQQVRQSSTSLPGSTAMSRSHSQSNLFQAAEPTASAPPPTTINQLDPQQRVFFDSIPAPGTATSRSSRLSSPRDSRPSTPRGAKRRQSEAELAPQQQQEHRQANLQQQLLSITTFENAFPTTRGSIVDPFAVDQTRSVAAPSATAVPSAPFLSSAAAAAAVAAAAAAPAPALAPIPATTSLPPVVPPIAPAAFPFLPPPPLPAAVAAADPNAANMAANPMFAAMVAAATASPAFTTYLAYFQGMMAQQAVTAAATSSATTSAGGFPAIRPALPAFLGGMQPAAPPTAMATPLPSGSARKREVDPNEDAELRDRRERNSAASARFRAKRRQELLVAEQKASQLGIRYNELQSRIAWLRSQKEQLLATLAELGGPAAALEPIPPRPIPPQPSATPVAISRA